MGAGAPHIAARRPLAATARHDPGECPRKCAAMFGTYRMVVAGVEAG